MEEEINNKRCLPPMVEAPWLVFTHGNSKHKRIQTFCTISSNNQSKSYIKSIPELHGKSIVESCRGWLILQEIQNEEKFSLWNPVTSETLVLPLLSAPDDDISSCALTDDPNSHTCVVLLFGDRLIYSYLPRRANSSWTTQEIEIAGRRPLIVYRAAIRQTITLDSIIYGLTTIANSDNDGDGLRDYLVSIEVAGDDTNFLNLTRLQLEFPDVGYRHYLVESCGRIYLVSISNDHHRRIRVVNVWELDFQGMKWVSVNCLDGRAFFVGDRYRSTWCWGTTNSYSQSQSGGGVEENCVYIINPDDFESVYLYRLKDNSLTLLLPCPNLVSPLDRPLWVMPQDQRFLAKPEWKQRIDQNLDVLPQGISTAEYKEPLQQDETQEENFFCELPLDVIEFISKYVHLFDHENFRASCKVFHSAVPIPQWRTNNLLPLFMFFKNDDGLCEVMDPCRNDSRHITLQLSRSPFTINFAKDGWLLVHARENILKFVNPFTGVMGEFPPCLLTPDATCIGFSTYPTSPDCLTVGIVDGIDHVEKNTFNMGIIHGMIATLIMKILVFLRELAAPSTMLEHFMSLIRMDILESLNWSGENQVGKYMIGHTC